jgi:hypothetical protein
MPFPALSFPQSAAIAVPICLAGYAVQEFYVRRRAVKRGLAEGPGVATGPLIEAPAGGAVTTGDAGPLVAPAKPQEGARTATARATTAKAPPRKPAARKAAPPTARPTAAPARPKPVARPKPASPKPRAPRKPAAARRAPAGKAATAAPALEDLQRRQATLRQALEAVIAFVDNPPRRATATACADALLLLVPRDERGANLAAYVHAAGAKEPLRKLQDLAEEAGVEMATAIKALNTEIRARQ